MQQQLTILIDISFITNEDECHFICSGTFGYSLLPIACSTFLHIFIGTSILLRLVVFIYSVYESFPVINLTNILSYSVVVPFSMVMKILI